MNRQVLAILSLGHLSVDIGAGALPALLPVLQSEFHFSYFWLAALVMTSGVTSSVMQPIFGVASDSLRTRFMLPAGVFLALAGYALIGLAPTYLLVATLVVAAGIGSAMYHPEGMKSARTVSGRLPTTANSVFAVGGNVGVALGPIIVTLLVGWHGLRGMWILIVPAVLVGSIVATTVPMLTRSHEAHTAQVRRTQAQPGAAYAMSVLVAVTSLRSMVYSGVLTFVPLYAVNVLHQGVAHNGVLLFAFLATGALANFAAGPVADRYGVRRTMTTSLALAPLAFALYLLTSGPLSLFGLALTGALVIGTLSTTSVMAMEYMPQRVALASALMIGVCTGLGSLGVGLLGRIADTHGLGLAVWALVGVAALSYGLTFALPKVTAHEHLLISEPKIATGL